MISATQTHRKQRLHLTLEGLLQGVGFRPFVYRLATELELTGWVRNSPQGVEIEIQGQEAALNHFLERIQRDRPTSASFSRLGKTRINTLLDDKKFEIRTSSQNQTTATKSKNASTWILPDLATCPDCLAELFDPLNHRYHYPFINCTQCGPRFSILKALPYDRPNTTMAAFTLCPACLQEYRDPSDRRFHGQPNACPHCGPQLELWDAQGNQLSPESNADMIQTAADRIRAGEIIALKGLGGFHLCVDAQNDKAVRRLRDRKHRPTKPLAVMYPNLDTVRQDCEVSPLEATLLTSPAAPIVLLSRTCNESKLSDLLAPHQLTLGVMLPYTPLHHLLLAELNAPMIATSGNLSHTPICIDNQDALERLGQIADVFLVHNRPIYRSIDDSVVRVMGDRPMVLRRARGYAPMPLPLEDRKESVIAVGGHLKNTVAISSSKQCVVSQHLGDLDDAQSLKRYDQALHQLLKLYRVNPAAIACDLHPDYASTQLAHRLSQDLLQDLLIPIIPIQHHYAHVLSGMVDNALDPPVFGVAWDGAGAGLDGTVWGGEFLVIPDRKSFHRVAHLRPFPLLGGDLAAKEPRRAALGLLYGALGEPLFQDAHYRSLPVLRTFEPSELNVLHRMLRQQINTPLTSSIGRLFDAIASLLDLCHESTYEGEAAMQLEAIAAQASTSDRYPLHLDVAESGRLVLDWQPMLLAILEEMNTSLKNCTTDNRGARHALPFPQGLRSSNKALIAAKFHNTLLEGIVAIAHHINIPNIVLTGGCFQNRYLLEGAITRLRQEGFTPSWHHQVPPNDGGLAVGQLLGATWHLEQQHLKPPHLPIPRGEQPQGESPCV